MEKLSRAAAAKMNFLLCISCRRVGGGVANIATAAEQGKCVEVEGRREREGEGEGEREREREEL